VEQDCARRQDRPALGIGDHITVLRKYSIPLGLAGAARPNRSFEPTSFGKPQFASLLG
jgi:hypothetical protein